MKFTLESLNQLPEIAGVYQLCDKDGRILYIGKAKNFKKRILSYFNKGDLDSKTTGLVAKVAFIGIIPVASEFEALLLEASLIKRNQPKYNVVWKDDKRYIHIKITDEEFPRILLSRREDERGVTYFGPFPSTKIIKDILTYVRGIFPYCTQSPKVKRKCFYTHLSLCNPCPADIRKQKRPKAYQEKKTRYLKNIKQIKLLLQGHVNKVKSELKTQMVEFSKREEFEQAAIFRDKLQKLNYLVDQYHPAESYIENPLLAIQTWDYEQKNLTEILRNYFTQLNLLKRIECYDVSCIFGKLAVGSMVTFINGQTAKNFYRRFRIKSKEAKDDLTMLKEVMERRLKHHEWQMPDLLVIDGGKPQLAVLEKVLTKMGVNIPIIGLAKETEELVIPVKDNFAKLKLPSNSAALHLIQRLRDEAHRFAHQYHKYLRLKHLMSTVEMGATL